VAAGGCLRGTSQKNIVIGAALVVADSGSDFDFDSEVADAGALSPEALCRAARESWERPAVDLAEPDSVVPDFADPDSAVPVAEPSDREVTAELVRDPAAAAVLVVRPLAVMEDCPRRVQALHPLRLPCWP